MELVRELASYVNSVPLPASPTPIPTPPSPSQRDFPFHLLGRPGGSQLNNLAYINGTFCEINPESEGRLEKKEDWWAQHDLLVELGYPSLTSEPQTDIWAPREPYFGQQSHEYAPPQTPSERTKIREGYGLCNSTYAERSPYHMFII